jgi:hypothetical protein
VEFVVVVVVEFVVVPLVASFDIVVLVVVVVELSVELFAEAAPWQAARLAAARTAIEARARVRTCVMMGISRCERERSN